MVRKTFELKQCEGNTTLVKKGRKVAGSYRYGEEAEIIGWTHDKNDELCYTIQYHNGETVCVPVKTMGCKTGYKFVD